MHKLHYGGTGVLKKVVNAIWVGLWLTSFAVFADAQAAKSGQDSKDKKAPSASAKKEPAKKPAAKKPTSSKRTSKKKSTKKVAKKPTAKSLSARAVSAENGLVGIKLFDSGEVVVRRYGSPDEIQAITLGGAGGGAAGGGGGAGPAGAGGASSSGAAPSAALDVVDAEGLVGDPFDTGKTDVVYQQAAGGGARAGGAAAGGGGGGQPGGGGATGRGATQYTRWVYRRSNSKYAFVMDKFSRVVQIEVIGISDPKARTKRGITFGCKFADVIKKYKAPDGYEIAGDNILMRFLQKDKVAFRLSRLEAGKPHRITGIVVAAAKR